MKQTTEQRFWSKVDKSPSSGCWLWTGEKSAKGYGRFVISFVSGKRKRVYAHRFSWEQTHDKIPDTLQIDHLCGIKNCVNPDHMEVVTSRENILRGMSPSAITYRTGICKRGHALSDDNIHVYSNGYRTCLICFRANQKRWSESHPEQARKRQGKRNEYFRQYNATRRLRE